MGKEDGCIARDTQGIDWNIGRIKSYNDRKKRQAKKSQRRIGETTPSNDEHPDDWKSVIPKYLKIKLIVKG